MNQGPPRDGRGAEGLGREQRAQGHHEERLRAVGGRHSRRRHHRCCHHFREVSATGGDGRRGKKKEPTWGVKSAHDGRVTPHLGSLNPINRELSRDSVKIEQGRRGDGGDLSSVGVGVGV